MSAPDIFFSYAREDQARVTPLVAVLGPRGWSVFWDRRIPAGKTWRTHIGRALDEARCVVVAWSEHSIQSDWVIEDADEGKRRGILIPVFLDAVSPPWGFRSIQAADLTGWLPQRTSPEFDSFLADLDAMLGAMHPGPPLPPSAATVSLTETIAPGRVDSGPLPSATPPASLATPPEVQVAARHRKAAEQGNADAQAHLGWLYQNGRGVAQDDGQAAAWYRKAAEQGYENAKAALKQLGQ